MGRHTCSKAMILSFAIIVLLIAIGLIVVGVLVETTDLFDFEIPDYFSINPQQWVEISGWVFIGVGSVMFLTSIAGVYGAIKLNKCLLFIYWITLMVLFLLFLGLTIAFPVILDPLYNAVKSSDCNYQNDDQKFASLFRLMDDTNELFQDLQKNLYCQSYTVGAENKDCTCYIEQPQIWKNALGDDFLNQYEITSDKQASSIVTVSECPDFQQALESGQTGITTEEYNQISGFAAYIEKTFDCTGICAGSPFYMFTNINRGIPDGYTSLTQTGGCKQKLVNFVGDYKDLTFYSVLGALILITINHFFIFYLCCQQKKNPRYLDSYLELTGDKDHRY